MRRSISVISAAALLLSSISLCGCEASQDYSEQAAFADQASIEAYVGDASDSEYEYSPERLAGGFDSEMTDAQMQDFIQKYTLTEEAFACEEYKLSASEAEKFNKYSSLMWKGTGGVALQKDSIVFEKDFKDIKTKRDWSKYTCSKAADNLTQNEKKFYSRLDEVALHYLTTTDDAIPAESGDRYYSLPIQYSDLGLSNEQSFEVYWYFRYNNPQYYFLDTSRTISGESMFFSFYNDFVDGEIREKETEKVFAVIDKWVKEITDDEITTYQKIYSADRLICQEEDYVADSPFCQSIYSTTMLKETVCAGYALSMTAILNAAGVDTYTALSPTHAWNECILDNGKSYATDATWNDGWRIPSLMNRGSVGIVSRDVGKESHDIREVHRKWLPEMPQKDYSPTEYDKTGKKSETKPKTTTTTTTEATTTTTTTKATTAETTTAAVTETTTVTAATTTTAETTEATTTTTTAAATEATTTTTTAAATEATTTTTTAAATETTTTTAATTVKTTKKTTAPKKTETTTKAVKVEKPENLSVHYNNADSSCTVMWNTVIDATEYEAELFINSSSADVITVTSPVVTVTQLVEANYSVKVRAIAKVGGKKYYSDWAELEFDGVDPRLKKSDLKRVSNVLELRGDKKSEITIMWDSTPGATEYEVELSDYYGYIETYTVSSPKITLDCIDGDLMHIVKIRAVLKTKNNTIYSEKVTCIFGETYFRCM